MSPDRCVHHETNPASNVSLQTEMIVLLSVVALRQKPVVAADGHLVTPQPLAILALA